MERIIGAQMYTIRDYIQNEKDIAESMQKLADIGYTTAQSSAMGEIEAEKLKDVIDKTGVTITGDHCNFQKMLDDTDAIIKYHKTIDCYTFGIGGLPTEARDTKEGILNFMKNANIIADKLADAGMTFTYHNHAFEFVRVEGKTIMDYILETANDNFKLMVDVYWLSVAGINPTKFMKKYADKICSVHYKDLKVVNNAPAICEIGVGNLDWTEICATCDELKPKFIYVEQDTNWTPDPFTSLKTSYDYLNKEHNYR